ncbi:putative glucan endo-1 [Ranunculus cassubicifolius]
MRIYGADQEVLQALRGSNIELILGVPNSDLQTLGDPSAATRWVQANVLNFWPDVRIKYIAVGNEVSPVNGASQFVPFLVPAMTNVYNAVVAAGLWGQVRVTTSLDTGVIGTSFPPSAGAFRGAVMSFMNPIIGFLTGTRAPLLVNIYTYFSHISNPGDISLSYALFTRSSPQFTDSGNGLPYQNLFDAMLDGFYSALEKASGSSLEIVVSESGWPSAGGTATTLDNACTYNQNLIRHVRTGSPKKPGPIETYLFAMFNENEKYPEYEKNFGLFYPNQAAVCTINFWEQVSDM